MGPQSIPLGLRLARLELVRHPSPTQPDTRTGPRLAVHDRHKRSWQIFRGIEAYDGAS
ncbi:hypothetical protein PGTUg99_015083 [Puccinia graminis f. sp. tritici]|uniref:Uncharacterized protein n=1 Tax=Puccinia graminis f. sp. tritici TaxID=56615 RepID=A0A5B0QGX9_PUCGR|nr:hypothetical protein PGTUg99_015083 [Puccinia graminis f. sp. tritici]